MIQVGQIQRESARRVVQFPQGADSDAVALATQPHEMTLPACSLRNGSIPRGIAS
jgi:hypothetical protein